MPTTLSQSVQPEVRAIDGLTLRYTEGPPREDDALLLRPWPDSLYDDRSDLKPVAKKTTA